MKSSLSFLALVTCLGISVASHASEITYNVTGGTLTPSGSFSGSFVINSVTELIDGGTFVVTVPSGTYSFVNAGNDASFSGLALFSDSSGDFFQLALHGAIGALAVNNLSNIYDVFTDTHLITFIKGTKTQFDATGATITTAVPEPSAFVLLGTGALGLVETFRRRVLNA